MAEVKKQRYICKICTKSCVSGNSLGGHMRVHFAPISASKKAAKAKAHNITTDSEDDDDQESYQLKNGSKIQSNSDFQNEDVDQCSNYELRENPKKSWRISDTKHGLNHECKKCGKGFLKLRALSGHMRSHSNKNNKKNHKCNKCGKGFASMKAMFGHMKSHSKRYRETVDDESDDDDSSSDLEALCPVRKKRSTIRYKTASNPSFSNLNESDCSVFELGDVKEVAKILIMLSRGVRDWSKFNSDVESSDNDDYDSVYFGDESYGKSKNLDLNDEGFVCDADKNLGSLFAKEELKFDFGDDDDDEKNETKVAFEVSDEFAVKFCSTNEPQKLNEFAVELDHVNELDKVSSSVQESGFETNCSENEANLEFPKGFEKNHEFKYKIRDKSREHECPTCFKVFSSGQALGGHKRAHYNNSGFTNESKNREVIIPALNQEAVVEVSRDLFDLNFPVTVDGGGKRGIGLSLWWAEMGREHEALVLTN